MKFILAILSALLCGCVASYPNHPESGHVPVSFKTEVKGTDIYTPVTDRCFAPGGGGYYRSIWGAHKVLKVGSVWPADTPGDTQEKTTLDKALGINYQKTIQVPASKEFVFFVEGVTGYGYKSAHYCGLMLGFTPNVGAVYNVLFLLASGGCNAIVREKSGNNFRSLTEDELTRYPSCS
ncbi:hypothetical protein [Marinimicrobium sp. ARAG 43.8]|uniref:hypothetical protein n=1 Tax=Marinimicrobium sp. ARAG 43.8 TaxID=3418719 RepID=UPI003CE867D6